MLRFYILFTLVIFGFSFTGNTQQFDQEKYDSLKSKLIAKKFGFSRKAGKVLIKLQELLSEEDFDQVIEIIENHDIEQYNDNEKIAFDQFLAAAYSNTNNNQNAIIAYQRILRNSNITFYLHRDINLVVANLYLLEQDQENALQFFNEYLTIEQLPTWPTYKAIIGAYIDLENYDEAFKYLEIAEEKNRTIFENYQNNLKARFQNRNDQYIQEISATRVMLTNALNGGDITTPIPKSEVIRNTKEKELEIDYAVQHYARLEYPENAAREKIEGYVVIQFDIDKNGNAKNLKLIESSNRIFDKTAITAVSKHKFKILKNANENGELVDQTIRHEFKIK